MTGRGSKDVRGKLKQEELEMSKPGTARDSLRTLTIIADGRSIDGGASSQNVKNSYTCSLQEQSEISVSPSTEACQVHILRTLSDSGP